MEGDSLNTDTDGFDFRAIFNDECKDNEDYFDKQDDVRQRLYLLLANSKNLSLKCSTLINKFICYANKTIITMEKRSLDLTSILMSRAERITDEYEFKELTPVLFKKQRPILFTELLLEANFNSKTKVIANAYTETKNERIGSQHIMYTTEPGSISDSSSSPDIEYDNSGSDSSLNRKRKRKTCQKAGNFGLAGHICNSHFNNRVKCQVEIFILVGNKGYCETLAKHLGLIWFESLLEGEEKIQFRLMRAGNIYRLAHTGIIKKMMNGYSNICITTSTSAWLLTPATVKGIIYTKDNERELYDGLQARANYCVLVENKILAYVDAIGKIVQKSLLCNVLMEVNYQVAEKAYTKIHLPITVLIPLYIVRYFSQSFIVTGGLCSNCINSNVVDIFEIKLNF